MMVALGGEFCARLAFSLDGVVWVESEDKREEDNSIWISSGNGKEDKIEVQ